MTSKTIDNIVWFIPFRKLRDNIRDYLLFQYNNSMRNYIYCYDCKFEVAQYRNEIQREADFLSKYINLIKNFDENSLKIINNIVSKIYNYNNIEDEIYFSYNELKELNKFYIEYWNKNNKNKR